MSECGTLQFVLESSFWGFMGALMCIVIWKVVQKKEVDGDD